MCSEFSSCVTLAWEPLREGNTKAGLATLTLRGACIHTSAGSLQQRSRAGGKGEAIACNHVQTHTQNIWGRRTAQKYVCFAAFTGDETLVEKLILKKNSIQIKIYST